MLSEELKALEENEGANKNIIITDIRSNEEFAWCKNNQFTIVHIERKIIIIKDTKLTSM